MVHILRLLLACVFSSPAWSSESGPGPVISTVTHTDSGKVFTTKGKECKFPFRQGGRIHHQCISELFRSPWCSLTSNFDRDRMGGYCASNASVHMTRKVIDLCQGSPCLNGGSCTSYPDSQTFACQCPDGFSGMLCEHKRCYETVHLRHYDTGESWGRINLRNVEHCTCKAGDISRQHIRTAPTDHLEEEILQPADDCIVKCRSNPCQNGGLCRLITSTRTEVCYCRQGYSGPHCSLVPDTECYYNRGRNYRGVVSTTQSGAKCLPWNSEMLYDELHLGTVPAAPLRGLGDHAYCRNPDGDNMPWCYTLSDGAISWEYCDIPPCIVASSRRVSINVIPGADKPVQKPVCGTVHKKRLAVSRGRILGGSSALPGTHPWMAAIYARDSFFCAGTLIASCWVVSAAHCFFDNPFPSQLRVVLGQQNLNVTNSNSRTFRVAKYIFHKRFVVFDASHHDIVLIKLEKQDGRCVKKTPFIRPICLPDKSTVFPDGYCCTISGWGSMDEKRKSYTTLQEAGVRLISHDTCRKPEVYGHHVTEGMICAGLNGCADACQGDSGGPLACARNDVSFLYGIVSWGEGCGLSGKPGVYTKVTHYIDWINSVIKRKPQKTL
ncbi:hepatocyte growth factor activator isoform 1-T2 [Synchiropus picturatus]